MGKHRRVRRPGKKPIFRAWKRLSNGKIVYPYQYGLKAFVFWVDEDKAD